MSNIASYPLITPKGGDLLVGSETYDINLANPVKGNPTRNFSVSSVVSTQIPSYVIGTVNKIPVFTSANKIQDSIMTETAAGGSFTGKYISVTAAGGGLSTQNLEVNKALIDGAGSTGTDGFLLSSTTVGGDKEVAWVANTSPYKVYAAELSNFGGGTVAPTATVFQNTLSAAIVWTRTGIGVYVGTLVDAFTASKSHCVTQSMIVANPSIGANGVDGVTDTNEWPAQQIASFTSTNTIQLNHFVLAQSGAATKSDNIKIFIEIKVYS